MSSNFHLYLKTTSTIQLLMVEKYSFSAPQTYRIFCELGGGEGAGVGELQCESWPTCFATNLNLYLICRWQ